MKSSTIIGMMGNSTKKSIVKRLAAGDSISSIVWSLVSQQGHGTNTSELKAELEAYIRVSKTA